ncbi:MAG: hypoxanthine phosphoribosyltransferase [Bacteroidaceae bacterium]|nr:hypoxanthine phosphoribosyltransferase [Bacteroidaceae bacterium]
MQPILVKDRLFKVSMPASHIQARVQEVGAQISRDYEGRTPIFISVLTGAFIFAADLVRSVATPSEIAFIRVASYEGMGSSGEVKQVLGLKEDIRDRDVIIVEDIIDSGLTMKELISMLEQKGPRSINICSLLVKPGNLKVQGLPIRYCCFEIPNDFILGYGLDYDGLGRELPDIYTVVE